MIKFIMIRSSRCYSESIACESARGVVAKWEGSVCETSGYNYIMRYKYITTSGPERTFYGTHNFLIINLKENWTEHSMLFDWPARTKPRCLPLVAKKQLKLFIVMCAL